VLLRRAILGQELTDREQKMLRRTLTDLASVIPIGFLMLLPVTAVGHAAILAAIQKYVPALVSKFSTFLFAYHLLILEPHICVCPFVCHIWTGISVLNQILFPHSELPFMCHFFDDEL
jgi:hypothetical protein